MRPKSARETAELSRGARRRARRRESALKSQRPTGAETSRMTGIVTGAVAAIAVAGTVVGTSFFNAPESDVDTTAKPARLPATLQHSVCPGVPKLPTTSEVGEDIDFSPISTDTTTQVTVASFSDLAGNLPGITARDASASGTAEQDDALAGADELSPSQDVEIQQGRPATGGPDGAHIANGFLKRDSNPGGEAGQPVLLTTEPLGGRSALAGAVTSYSASDGDLTGLSVAPCAAPGHQHWMTGVTTTLGTTAVLTLTNPSGSSSSVDIELFGTEGRIDAAGTSGLVLAPNQTRSFIVGGLAPNEEAVALRISAKGGAIAPSVQQHRLDGVTPQGVEIIQPGADPARTAVMPGITISEDNVKIARESELAGAEPTVFITTTTGSPTTANIELIDAEGKSHKPEQYSVDIDATTTVAVPLDGIEPGTYTVQVESEAAIIASTSAWMGTPGKDLDFATLSGTSALGLDQVVALPSTGTATLELFASDDAVVEITPLNAAGDPGKKVKENLSKGSTTLEIPGEKTAAVRIETGASGVYAAVNVTQTDGMSAYPVAPAKAPASGVPVRVGF